MKTFLSLGRSGWVALLTIIAANFSKAVPAINNNSTMAVASDFLDNLTWDSESKYLSLSNNESAAHFVFNFTNLSSTNVTIVKVEPSCGCTKAQMQSLPWIIDSGSQGQIEVTVDIAAKSGTLLKTVDVVTDKGLQRLYIKIDLTPFKLSSPVSDAERAQNMKMAMDNRQAIFQGNCVNCHSNPARDKYGKELYDTACAICHDGERRATMVPNLHAVSQATNREFWRTWISYGRPHSLMPAFAAAEGGSLTDAQIASLADYLVGAIPSKKF